jgi:hypothetical protein
VDLTVDSGLVDVLGRIARSSSLLVWGVASLLVPYGFGVFLVQLRSGRLARGQALHPGTPSVLGHIVDFGSAVAWSSCVNESSNT